jgi:predicted nucleic acid-binding protein
VLTSRGRLGDGEWEAIALAVELGAAAILIDDRPARRVPLPDSFILAPDGTFVGE